MRVEEEGGEGGARTKLVEGESAEEYGDVEGEEGEVDPTHCCDMLHPLEPNRPLNTSCQYKLSTHPLNAPCQCNLSMHPLNSSSHHTYPLTPPHPSSPLSLIILLIIIIIIIIVIIIIIKGNLNYIRDYNVVAEPAAGAGQSGKSSADTKKKKKKKGGKMDKPHTPPP